VHRVRLVRSNSWSRPFFVEAILTTPSRSPEGHVTITINEPQKGVSPGQVAAVWLGDWCLGCGTITSTDQSSALRDADQQALEESQWSQAQYLARQRQSAQMTGVLVS